MKDVSWFVSICAENGLRLSDDQAASFENYLTLLLSWNSRVNLISRKDEENFYPHQALNCISFLFSRKLKPDAKILDLGTGGGLPGIPLKIIYGNLDLTLLDSIAKKTTALTGIVEKMKLEKVEVVTGRAENLAKSNGFHGKFDYVVTRAAGKLDEVTRWSQGFLAEPELMPSPLNDSSMIPKGTLIVLKGGAIDDELRAARRLKFVESIEVNEIDFNGMDELAKIQDFSSQREKKIILIKYSVAEKKN